MRVNRLYYGSPVFAEIVIVRHPRGRVAGGPVGHAGHVTGTWSTWRVRSTCCGTCERSGHLAGGPRGPLWAPGTSWSLALIPPAGTIGTVLPLYALLTAPHLAATVLLAAPHRAATVWLLTTFSGCSYPPLLPSGRPAHPAARHYCPSVATTAPLPLPWGSQDLG